MKSKVFRLGLKKQLNEMNKKIQTAGCDKQEEDGDVDGNISRTNG